MLAGLVLPQIAFQSFNITVNSSNSFAHYLAFPKRWPDNTYRFLDEMLFESVIIIIIHLKNYHYHYSYYPFKTQ
jgi:hypothetical protein